MYKPQFPYIGNQAIITSDRVTLLAGKDSVFVFGNQAVSLSSQHTINLDAKDKIILSSPKIELGNKAEALGEPIILGNALVHQLVTLLDDLIVFVTSVREATYGDLSTIESNIAAPADVLYNSLPTIRNAINNSVRSNKVFLQKN